MRKGGRNFVDIGAHFLSENKGLLGDIHPEVFVYCWNISHKYRYMYYAIPKTGCSTLKLTLERAEREDDSFSPSTFDLLHERKRSVLLLPTQMESFWDALMSGRYLRFCFVRNPFTRLLSCYLDRICRARPEKAVILRQLGRADDDLEQPVAFDEFLDAVAAQPYTHRNSHWGLQWYYAAEGRIPFDLVGRWEHLERDIADIAARTGIDFDRYYRRERRNETRCHELLSEYYDPRLSERVRELYALDFEMFDYSRDLPG